MPHRNLFQKILFCTDFNSDAQKAFLYALNIAMGNKNSELVIFHAIPEADAQFWKSYLYEVEDVDMKAEQAIADKIASCYLDAMPASLRWRSRHASGNVGDLILETAKEEDADILIIGRGAGTNIINRLLGNFTEKVVRHAHCPVLVIPEESH